MSPSFRFVSFCLASVSVLFPTACISAAPPKTIEAGAGAARKVLVLPFNVSGDERLAWLGEALARDLAAEVSHGGARGITPASAARPGAVPATLSTSQASTSQTSSTKQVQAAPAAAEMGRDAGADMVVSGSAQVLGDELRVSGNVIVTSDARVLGALKATGPLRDLFRLEDALSEQLDRLLAAQSGAPSAVQAPPAPAPNPASVYPPQPGYANPYDHYASGYYTYPYSYYSSPYSYYRSPYSSYYVYTGIGHAHHSFGHISVARPHIAPLPHIDHQGSRFRSDIHAGGIHAGGGGHITGGGGHITGGGGHITGGGGHITGGGGHITGGGHVSGGHSSGHIGGGGHVGGGHH